MQNLKLLANPPINAEVLAKASVPWSGCGTRLEITGCRFSLNVMSDRFVEVILGALEDVKTNQIWSETDLFSTVYRGRRVAVLDGTAAFLAQACKRAKGAHLTMELTFSKGCPGDVAADYVLAPESEAENWQSLLEQRLIDRVVDAKIMLLPLGNPDYMQLIAYCANLAIVKNLFVRSSHYASILRGSIADLWVFFNDVMAFCEARTHHYVFEVSLSVNSPSLNEE